MQASSLQDVRKRLFGVLPLLIMVVLVFALIPLEATFAATLTVNVAGDVSDLTPGDGNCDDGNGRCSLRGAIEEANALGGADIIDFSVGGTLSFDSALPDITSTITINGGGITLSGSSANRVLFVNGGSLTLNSIIIADGNAGMGYGGGVNNASGTLVVNNSAFVSNVGVYGGAIFNEGGSTTVTNSSFTNNTAMFNGSAIRNGSGTITVTNSTISGNPTGFDGGSISNSGTANVRNTIVYNNIGVDCNGMINALNNLTEDGSCGATLTDDPLLGGFNGFYFPLQSGSPAIDAGDNGVCPANDQRGAARPQDGDGDTSAVCDIGAYEADTVIFTDTPTPTPTNTPTQVTDTPTPTHTPSPTGTATMTSTPSETPMFTATPSQTPTPTMIPPTATVPPPPPTPLCEDHNFDDGGVVRASTADALGYAINCRVLYQNGHPTQWLGGDLYNAGSIGIQGIFDLGVQQAVDIFSPVGMTYFEGGAVFCLRGQGTLIWLAASGSPRHPEIIGSYTVDDFPGFTCATLFEPGTLVLVHENPTE